MKIICGKACELFVQKENFFQSLIAVYIRRLTEGERTETNCVITQYKMVY